MCEQYSMGCSIATVPPEHPPDADYVDIIPVQRGNLLKQQHCIRRGNCLLQQYCPPAYSHKKRRGVAY